MKVEKNNIEIYKVGEFLHCKRSMIRITPDGYKYLSFKENTSYEVLEVEDNRATIKCHNGLYHEQKLTLYNEVIDKYFDNIRRSRKLKLEKLKKISNS